MLWVKFDPGAWLSGTRELSDVEKAVYIDLIMVLYDRDGEVPNDDNVVCRMLQRDPRSWRKAKTKLMAAGKIRLVGDRWTANRVEFELNSARSRLDLGSKKSNSSMISKPKTADFGSKKSENPNISTVNALSRVRARDNYNNKDIYSGTDSERAKAPAPSATIPVSSELIATTEQWLKHPVAKAPAGSLKREHLPELQTRQPLKISEELIAHEHRKRNGH